MNNIKDGSSIRTAISGQSTAYVINGPGITVYIGLLLRAQSALELGPSHCPNARLGQDLGFGRFAFALKLPELLNTNLPTVRAKLGQTSSFLNGPQIWFPIGQ